MTVDLLSPPLRRACSGTWGRPSQHSLLTGTILIERRIYPIAFRRISTANHHRRTGSITYASSILPDT